MSLAILSVLPSVHLFLFLRRAWLFQSFTTATLLVSFWAWFMENTLVAAMASYQVCALVIFRLWDKIHPRHRGCQSRNRILSSWRCVKFFHSDYWPCLQCWQTVDYNVWNAASNEELVPEKISKGSLSELCHQLIPSMMELTSDTPLVIMFESSMPLTITDYAMNRSGVKNGTSKRDV